MRGLADILPLQVAVGNCRQQIPAVAALELSDKSEGPDDEILRQQVVLFEDQVRKLIGRITWLQESLQHEEEGRSAAEQQAECLGRICAEQATKLDELSQQVSVFFEELDVQQRHWNDLEAEIEVERQCRLQMEEKLNAVGRGEQKHKDNLVPLSNRQQAEYEQHQAAPNKNGKELSMFRELASQWTNYKAQGKSGSWSLAKALRRLSFTDSRKKASSGEFDCDMSRLTEEIFKLDSEASDLRHKHLEDLRGKLESQEYLAPLAEVAKAEETKKLKFWRARDKSKQQQAKKYEADRKALMKIECLNRQIWQLKNLSADKAQLVKVEKKRRQEAEKRNYAAVKSLEKQVLQLKKLNLRKAEEVKQERSKRQEAESRNLGEMEALEKQVQRLTKLASGRAQELKREHKQRMEAERRLRDLNTQMKVSMKREGRPASVKIRDDGFEQEAIQFKKTATPGRRRRSPGRCIWKLSTTQDDCLVLESPSESVRVVEEDDQARSSENHSGETSVGVYRSGVSVEGRNLDHAAESEETEERKAGEESTSVSLHSSSVFVEMQPPSLEQSLSETCSGPRNGTLVQKLSQLKETTSRLLKDLEGARAAMQSSNKKAEPRPQTVTNHNNVLEPGQEEVEFTGVRAAWVMQGNSTGLSSSSSLSSEQQHIPGHLNEYLLLLRRAFRKWSSQAAGRRGGSCCGARLTALEKRCSRLESCALGRAEELEKGQAETRRLCQSSISTLDGQLRALRREVSDTAQSLRLERSKRQVLECLRQSFCSQLSEPEEKAAAPVRADLRCHEHVDGAAENPSSRHTIPITSPWDGQCTNRRLTAWKQGLVTLDQALVLCMAAFLIFSTGPDQPLVVPT